MIPNKKGALMHFIILGVLVSIGIFILVTRTGDLAVIETKGIQQLNFLNNVYLKAETNLLFIDQNAKEAGWKAVNTLLEEPGTGDCGYVTDNFLGVSTKINLLNQKEGWCLQNVRNKFSELVTDNLKITAPDNTFSEIKSVGTDLTAKGSKENIKNKKNSYHYQSYTYDTSFRVPLGYDLEEFENIIASAKYLVEECRNYEQLDDCINNNFEKYFSNNVCSVDEIIKEDRKRVICVPSPNKYSIYTEQKVAVPVEYQLTLDFTPTGTLKSYSLNGDDGILVSFAKEEGAESYGIYYTDYLVLEGQTGDIQGAFNLVPEVLGYTIQTFWITNWQESCSFTNYNQAYLCADQIIYKFSGNEFSTVGNNYLFLITSISEGVESNIKETILIE